MTKKKNESGVTFFELMTVLGIMGIMCSIAIPNLIAWRNNAKVRGVAYDIRSDLQMAKLRAIRSGSTNVAISFSRDSYQVFLDSGNDYSLSGDTLIASRTVDGTTLEASFSGGGYTSFNNKGQATRAGFVKITNGHNSIVISLSTIGFISM